MYKVNEQIAEEIEKDSRTFRLYAVSTDGQIYFDPERIFSANSQRQSTSKSDDIELGAICSEQWETEIYSLNDDILGRRFKIFIYLADRNFSGITYGNLKKYTCGFLKNLTVNQAKNLGSIMGDPIPMGEYTCVKVNRNAESSTVTFADRLYFSDKKYVPKIAFPASFSEVENDICNQLGLKNGCTYPYSKRLKENGGNWLDAKGKVHLKTKSFYFEIENLPAENVTMRQMLSYIASAMGQCGYINREGEYVRTWYGSDVDYILDKNRIDTPTLGSANVIKELKCKIDDSTTLSVTNVRITDGRTIEFENPLMTEELMNLLYSSLTENSWLTDWQTAEINLRLGDPRLDIMDTCIYGGNRMPVTSLAFSYDGGLSAAIKSAGKNSAEEIIIEKE